MAAQPQHFTMVLDSAGDPALVAALLPRCPSTGCNRIVRGPAVAFAGHVYHEACWSSRARERLREDEE